MEKLKKTSKIVDTMLKLVFLVACAELMILFVNVGGNQVVKLLEKPDAEHVVITSLGVGSAELHFVEDHTVNFDTNYLIEEIIIEFGAGLFQFAVNCYIIYMLRKILAPMIQGQPYNGTVSRNLKKLGVGVIVIGIVTNVIAAIKDTAVYRMEGVADAILSDIVKEVELHVSINVLPILVGVLVLILSLVFRYGEELQVQADETL